MNLPGGRRSFLVSQRVLRLYVHPVALVPLRHSRAALDTDDVALLAVTLPLHGLTAAQAVLEVSHHFRVPVCQFFLLRKRACFV